MSCYEDQREVYDDGVVSKLTGMVSKKRGPMFCPACRLLPCSRDKVCKNLAAATIDQLG